MRYFDIIRCSILTKFFIQLLQEVKVFSPDYKEVDKETAYQDFVERIKHYEEAYEPLTLDHDG